MLDTSNHIRHAFEKASRLAGVDLTRLQASRAAIVAAMDSGGSRELELALRGICPEDQWQWPAAIEALAQRGQRGTWRQQIAMQASLMWRDVMWGQRLKQLQELQIDRLEHNRSVELEFRAVGDSLDPPDCAALDGYVADMNSSFWASRAPWLCERPDCRCTVRSISPIWG